MAKKSQHTLTRKRSWDLVISGWPDEVPTNREWLPCVSLSADRVIYVHKTTT